MSEILVRCRNQDAQKKEFAMNCHRIFEYGLLVFYTALPVTAYSGASDSTSSDRKPGIGELRTDGKGIQQVWVVPGAFQMGTSDSEAAAVRDQNPPAFVVGELPSERPKHLVRITHGYWIDKYEVTYAAFQAFVADSGYCRTEYWSDEGKAWLAKQNPTAVPFATGREAANQPRVNITWYEAEAYAHWRGGRLPTEAEWEFAARSPHSFIYPWGNIYDTLKAKSRIFAMTRRVLQPAR
jgi:formylglycine-generating enzyme required for sulfatase activity